MRFRLSESIPPPAPVFNHLYIHDDATGDEPRRLFQRFHREIRDGERVLVKRRMALQVHDRALDKVKTEYLVEYDVVLAGHPWWKRTEHTVVSFHHRSRLNGHGVVSWRYVDDAAQHRLTVLACRCSLLPNYCT